MMELRKSEEVQIESELKLSISETLRIEALKNKALKSESKFIEDFKFIKEKYSEVATNIIGDIDSNKKVLKNYNEYKLGSWYYSSFFLIEPYSDWYLVAKLIIHVAFWGNGFGILFGLFNSTPIIHLAYMSMVITILMLVCYVIKEIVKYRNKKYFENGPLLLFNAIVLIKEYNNFNKTIDKKIVNKIYKKYDTSCHKLARLYNDNITEIDDFKLMVEQFNI